MDDHEAAAADVSRARIGHGHGKTGSHRCIDRIAATPQYIGADACRYFLLCDHHAVFGDNRMNGVGGNRLIDAAAPLLRACGQPARNDQHDACEYPAWLGCKEAHQKSAAS